MVERLDDIPVLLAIFKRLGLAEVIDKRIPRHWLQQGLSVGQLAEAFLAYIFSQSDHCKVHVREWARQQAMLLEELFGIPIRDTDFTDDRLGQVLRHLSDDAVWTQIEADLWEQSIQVYNLRPERARLDATSVSGFHTVHEGGLMQYGYNPRHPGQPQIKMMVGSVDIGSNGHLVATDVISGERADDPLYIPILQRLRETLKEKGLLYIGDSKMSAVGIRADIVSHGDFYLMPLAEVGEISALLDSYVESIVAGNQIATLISSEGKTPEVIGGGYETHWILTATLPDGKSMTWEERVLIVRSQALAARERANLEHRLDKANTALQKLTPAPGRGKQAVRDEVELHERVSKILSRHGVANYLHYEIEKVETTIPRYIGRGRGGPNRPQRTVTECYYRITSVTRDESAITEATWRMGWRLYGTNQPADILPLEQAIPLYRRAPCIERHFHLLKSMPVEIEPLWVRRDDQIKGMNRLLSLGVRTLTLIEIVARRSLSEREETLPGLYEGNPKQETAQPTASRMLRAFRYIHRIRFDDGKRVIDYVTPLSPLQQRILSIIGLDQNIYNNSC